VDFNTTVRAQAFEKTPAVNGATGARNSDDHYNRHFGRCSVCRTKFIVFLAYEEARKL
jgi:hypothetical protein